MRPCANGVGRVCGVVMLVSAGGSAMALPSLTAHRNDPAAITWQMPGADRTPANAAFNPAIDMHQHRDAKDLRGELGEFKTYASWDNNQWRYNTAADRDQTRKNGSATDYGHGYMAQAATFMFDATFNLAPAAAKTRVQDAIDIWTGTVNDITGTTTSTVSGLPIKTQIQFSEVQQNADITIRFSNFYYSVPIGAETDDNKDFLPTDSFIPEEGEEPAGDTAPNGGGRAYDRTLAVWVPRRKELTFNANLLNSPTHPWYFGVNANAVVAPNAFDFLTTAIHEWGHVLGLDHPDNALPGTNMFPQQSTRGYQYNPADPNSVGLIGIVQAIDIGSLDGAKDLYTIAIPEPASLGVCAVGALAMLRRRR